MTLKTRLRRTDPTCDEPPPPMTLPRRALDRFRLPRPHCPADPTRATTVAPPVPGRHPTGCKGHLRLHLLSGDSPAGPGVPVAHAVLLPTTPARAYPAGRQRADRHPRRVADGVPVRICAPHRDGARARRAALPDRDLDTRRR